MVEQDLDLPRVRGVIPIYNPMSTVKLGTDDGVSSDVLDMYEDLQIGSLSRQVAAGHPSVVTAAHLFRPATENGSRACRIEAGALDAAGWPTQSADPVRAISRMA